MADIDILRDTMTLSDDLYNRLADWIVEYIQFYPEHYVNGKPTAKACAMGLKMLIESGTFDSIKELKIEFLNEKGAILPDFLFEGVKENEKE